MAKEMKRRNAFGESLGSIQESPLTDMEFSDATYDKKFKQLFTRKEFLVPILKNIIPEYRDCALEEIEILINPHGDVTVNPQAYDSEDSGKGNEAVTRYDVLIDCTLPNKDEVCVDIFFDLEMQRESKPGYPVPKRGIYYCCRLVSRQIETLGRESYNQLKPVYSVWILLNNIPKDLQNSVYTARMSGSFDNGAEASEINKQVDLIHLSLIYLSDTFAVKEGQDDLIRYLQSVFTKQVDNKYYNPYYEYSGKVKKEVDEVMTIMESFEERGIRIGEARGVKIGEARGVISIMLEDNKSDDEIIRRLCSLKRNPLTKEQAIKALENYKKEDLLEY